MSSYITKNWRGKPLITRETVMKLIASTKRTKGLDAFVEKPMACSVAEAEAMKEQALKEGKVLMVGHMWRFDREVRYLANLVSSEKIGRIFKTTGYGICRIHTNWGPAGWFTQKKLSGGGALVDMGIHAIDTVRFILGDPHPVKVYARIGTYMKDFDVDDTGVLMINYLWTRDLGYLLLSSRNVRSTVINTCTRFK